MKLRIANDGATAVRAFFLITAALTWVACSSADRVTAPTTAAPGTIASPPPSAGHSLVYAAHAGMVVLVNAGLGGTATPGASTPTRVWGWTGVEWRLLDSSGPPIRNLAGVTYDTRRQTLVMHGGSYDLGRTYGDTWEWSAGWRQVGGDGPGVRDHTQLAFDSVRGRAVLFGGSGADPAALSGDTWEFDGTQWSRVATTGPPPRVHHAMQFDPVTREVVLHGGNGAGGVTLGDTWGWDGSRWTPRGAGEARSHARMAFDAGLNALVLAGSSAPGVGIDMLVRRGSTWTSAASAAQPPSRYLTDLAYDERRNLMVLFGGGMPGGATLYDDTWEYDGSAWRRAR